MHDYSYKLLFLGLSGLMVLVALYGSQAGPTLLAGNTASLKPAMASTQLQSPPIPHPRPGNDNGTATIIPNGTSCPAANAGALLSPPSAAAAIGQPSPETASSQLQTGANMGSGSSCPPAPADAKLPGPPASSADRARSRLAANPQPGISPQQ